MDDERTREERAHRARLERQMVWLASACSVIIFFVVYNFWAAQDYIPASFRPLIALVVAVVFTVWAGLDFTKRTFKNTPRDPQFKYSRRLLRHRINGQFYRDMPDGHRKAFVAAALDMLCVGYLYAASKHTDRFEKMMACASTFEIDELCAKFDGYIDANGGSLSDGAALEFLKALNGWSGCAP